MMLILLIDQNGIFKLLIAFDKDLTDGSILAASELMLTALGESGTSVGGQLGHWNPFARSD